MKLVPDKSAQFGPPDRCDNFISSQTITSRKRPNLSLQDDASIAPKRQHHTVCVDNSAIKYIPDQHLEVIGKRARMKFEDESGTKWYEGIISSYNVITGKYGVYFPCDGQTEETSFNDNDMEIID